MDYGSNRVIGPTAAWLNDCGGLYVLQIQQEEFLLQWSLQRKPVVLCVACVSHVHALDVMEQDTNI